MAKMNTTEKIIVDLAIKNNLWPSKGDRYPSVDEMRRNVMMFAFDLLDEKHWIKFVGSDIDVV